MESLLTLIENLWLICKAVFFMTPLTNMHLDVNSILLNIIIPLVLTNRIYFVLFNVRVYLRDKKIMDFDSEDEYYVWLSFFLGCLAHLVFLLLG